MSMRLIRSLGRLTPQIAGVVALVLACGVPMSSAAAAGSTGTLIVEVEYTTWAGATYDTEAGPFWVYLSDGRGTAETGGLFAKGVRSAAPAGYKYVTQVQGELSGHYRLIVVYKYYSWFIVERVCNDFDVTPGSVTRVRAKCAPLKSTTSKPATALSPLSSPTAILMREQTWIQDMQAKCADQLAPLFAIYNKIRAEPPKRAVVALPAEGKTELTGANGIAGPIFGLELDAEQVRILVKLLHDRCWDRSEWGRLAQSVTGLSSQERGFAEILDQTVESERAKIRRLSGIADILDNVARSQKR